MNFTEEKLLTEREILNNKIDVLKEADIMEENNRTLDNLLISFLLDNKKTDELDFLNYTKKLKVISSFYFNTEFVDFVMRKLDLPREPKFQDYPVEYLKMAFSPGFVKILTKT
mgnify:CR=1 FL=1